MTHLLDVYYRQEKAGALSQEDGGALSFTYDHDYLARKESRSISFSMPLQEKPYTDRAVRPFFSGLLPDEGARQRLAGAWDFLRQYLWPFGGRRRRMRGSIIALSCR